MRWPTAFPALILLLAVNVAHAQAAATQQELETRLKSQFLMLRGIWDGPKLAFDSQGNLIGTAGKIFFSLSAVVVDEVALSDGELEIRGRRAGLDFRYKSPVGLQSVYPAVKSISASPYGKNNLDITIHRDPQHPEQLAAVLDKVFSIGIDETLLTSAPHYWHWFLEHYLSRIDNSASTGRDSGIRNPILKYAPDSLLQQEIKLLHVTGVSVIGLTVDANGAPQDAHVVRPLGMGADEYAVAQVLQYRFAAAMNHGQPVPVEINIEVNFRAY